MITKTHSRLSTYTVYSKIKPTLDKIQSSLGLTSQELRQIILRMASLIEIKVNSDKAFSNESSIDDSSFEKHLSFFMNEGMSFITFIDIPTIFKTQNKLYALSFCNS